MEFITDVELIMIRKLRGDISANWVDQKMLDTTYAFACRKGLDNTFTGVGSSSYWGIFHLKEDKRICNKYERYVIPFHECLFSLIDFRLPLNHFKIDILNHMIITPSQLNLVSWAYIMVFQHWSEYEKVCRTWGYSSTSLRLKAIPLIIHGAMNWFIWGKVSKIFRHTRIVWGILRTDTSWSLPLMKNLMKKVCNLDVGPPCTCTNICAT